MQQGVYSMFDVNDAGVVLHLTYNQAGDHTGDTALERGDGVKYSRCEDNRLHVEMGAT